MLACSLNTLYLVYMTEYYQQWIWYIHELFQKHIHKVKFYPSACDACDKYQVCSMGGNLYFVGANVMVIVTSAFNWNNPPSNYSREGPHLLRWLPTLHISLNWTEKKKKLKEIWCLKLIMSDFWREKMSTVYSF